MKILMMINIIIWTILINISCKHEPCIDPSQVFNQKAWDRYTQAASNGDTIVDFMDGCPGFGTYVLVNKYDYSDPCFNSNNLNQIAYVRHENNILPYINEIWTFDVSTGERKLLTNIHGSGLQWSKKDWLIFKARNNMLYKIKSNGDSLTQLTFDGEYNYDASWNGEGDKFVYRKTVGGEGYCIIANEEGVALDTVVALYRSIARKWSKGTKISGSAGTPPNFGVGYCDILNDSLIQIDVSDNNNIQSTDWVNDNLIWVSTGNGNNKKWQINSTNILSRVRTLIKNGFVNRQYKDLDISDDEKKIIVERRDLSQISACKIAERNYLYIMNIDGSDERRINIPE